MPTALKTTPRPRTGKHLARKRPPLDGGRSISNLRARPLEPDLDDDPMVAVYAISSVLIVVGVFLLSV